MPLALGVAAVLAIISGWFLVSGGVPARFTPSSDPAVLAMARADPPPRADGGDCQPDADGFAQPCTLMPLPGAQGRIALFGDSHAQAILPAFLSLAKSRGLELHYAASGGCPPLIGGYVLNGNDLPQACAALAAAELAHARTSHVDTVYLVGRWVLYAAEDPLNPPGRYLLADSAQPLLWSRADSARVLGPLLAKTVDAYRAAGIRVVIVDQVPTQQFRLDRYVKWLALKPPAEGLEAAIIKGSVRADAFLALRAAAQPALGAQEVRAVPVLRLEQAFESGDRFLWGKPGESWYRDANHLSTQGALKLAPALIESHDRAGR